ncbi:hypothetical protein [Limosilactobacillus gastricus]|uniref:hypothetical protein n=1 Tax=Limosilactobacillus gastricus TaxID=227942 RepID=UPI0005916A68|nr:hypothetical protein [Limosilactobacillus gastricus]
MNLKMPLCPFCDEIESLESCEGQYQLLLSDDGDVDLYINNKGEMEWLEESLEDTFKFRYCPLCGKNLIYEDE